VVDVTATRKGCRPAVRSLSRTEDRWLPGDRASGFDGGRPEDHFTDSRELYVLVEGDEWAHMEALDPDAGYPARRFAQLVNWRARGEKAVIEPSSLQRRNSSSS
jgi:hypothetical protein